MAEERSTKQLVSEPLDTNSAFENLNADENITSVIWEEKLFTTTPSSSFLVQFYWAIWKNCTKLILNTTYNIPSFPHVLQIALVINK